MTDTATLLSVQQIYRFCKQFEENKEYPTELAILSLLNYCKEENDNRVVNDRVEMRARHTLLRLPQQPQFVTVVGLQAHIRAGWTLSYMKAFIMGVKVEDDDVISIKVGDNTGSFHLPATEGALWQLFHGKKV